jgi:hypothetical protein
VAGVLLALCTACLPRSPSRPPAAPRDPAITAVTPVVGMSTADGTHTVSWRVGDECGHIPADARQRSYAATMDNGIVTLRTGVFLEGRVCTLSGLGCNQFRMTQDGDSVAIRVQSDNEWHGGSIVERLQSGTWLALTGSGSGRVEGTTIQVTLQANLWYCPTAMNYPFPCRNFVACRTSGLQMTIVKQNP